MKTKLKVSKAIFYFLLLFIAMPTARATSYRLNLDIYFSGPKGIEICLKSRFSKDGSRRLDSVSVEDSASPSRVLWRIYAASGKTWPVKCFGYGEVVGGLTEITAASQLEDRKFYLLSISAWGEKRILHFRIVETRGRRMVEVFDELPQAK